MAVYKKTAVHFVLGMLGVFVIIIAGVMMELSSLTMGIVMGIAALITAPLLYLAIKKVPKHDDDIHVHEKDERTPVRGKKTEERSPMRGKRTMETNERGWKEEYS